MTNTPSTPDPSNEHSDDHEIGAASDSEDSPSDQTETSTDDHEIVDDASPTDDVQLPGDHSEDVTADLAPTDEPIDELIDDDTGIVADDPTDVYPQPEAGSLMDDTSTESPEDLADLLGDEPDVDDNVEDLADVAPDNEEPAIADDTDNAETEESSNSYASQGSTPGPETTGFPGTVGPHYVQPLMRDRYGMLGGIASGVGKRYGLDISLVRIAFVLAGLTGIGILAYLAAWIIIPKSPVPLPILPVDPDQTRKALGAALIGGALLFGLTTVDALGSILVPLGLLGAGIWLLSQRPNTPATVGGQMPPAQNAQPGEQAHAERYAQATRQAHAAQSGRQFQSAAPANAYGARPVQPVQAQAPRKVKGRWLTFILGFLVAGALLSMAVAAVGFAFFASSDAYIEANEDWGSVEFENVEVGGPGEARVVRPESLDDLPADAFGSKSLTLDLTDIDTEALSASEPLVDSEFVVLNGTLEVIIPADLDVAIDASVVDGGIEVVGSDGDTTIYGTDIDHQIDADNPDLNLDLAVTDGTIIIAYE